MLKKRILIAEDESETVLHLTTDLEKLGYIVAGQVDRGEIAIQKTEELLPDLVLMEIHLNGQVNGIEAAKHIHVNLGIPVVFISTQADTVTLNTAMLAQAYGLIIKPYETPELKSHISLAIYKHDMERKLRESEERYALAARASNDGIWDWNLKTNEIYYSTRWKEMLGYKENEIGIDPQDWFRLVHPNDQELVQKNLVSHLKGFTPHFECEYRIRHSNGNYLWVLSRGLAVRDSKGTNYRMAGSQTDITSRKIAEDRLAHDAVHDALTGLPNRVLFLDRLQNRLERMKRNSDNLFAIMFIDLDRFKVVNDSLGHAAGDQLLVTVANRLKFCLRPDDTISRLGGDEFAILLDSVTDINDIYKVADRIKGRLITTTNLGVVERSPTASIGIVMSDSRYKTADELLRDADAAMYNAKARGGNQYQLFDNTMYTTAVELIRLEGELKHAVEREEWLIHYQPIFSLANDKLVGAEALVRWRHPQRGILSPKEFIGTAEDTGLIVPIGEFVLRTACLQAKAWREAGQPRFWVSVNLSGRQFHDQNLVDTVKHILSETGLSNDGLQLEITESVAMRNLEQTISLMTSFAKLGITISLDDFGTGHSSLSYLKQFPLKVLKIDKSFIQDIQSNKKNESLVLAIISLARSLDLEVVAEGVEKDEQLRFLRSRECSSAQGFLLSHPLPAEELTRVLISSNTIYKNPGK